MLIRAIVQGLPERARGVDLEEETEGGVERLEIREILEEFPVGVVGIDPMVEIGEFAVADVAEDIFAQQVADAVDKSHLLFVIHKLILRLGQNAAESVPPEGPANWSPVVYVERMRLRELNQYI